MTSLRAWAQDYVIHGIRLETTKHLILIGSGKAMFPASTGDTGSRLEYNVEATSDASLAVMYVQHQPG